MDDVSECDWLPPIEVGAVESEILEIPSCLPSLEDFIKNELENEEITKPEVEEGVDESPTETHREIEISSAPEVPLEDAGSIAEDQEEVEEIIDFESEDDFELLQVEIEKPAVKQKKRSVQIVGVDSFTSDIEGIKRRAQKRIEEKLRMKLIESTEEIIDELIGDVVEYCQYEDPDDGFRARLDRDRIIEEMSDVIYELGIEQDVRFFLNQSVVEHFEEENKLRPLIDDSPRSVYNRIQTFEEDLIMVNKYQSLAEPLKQLMDTKIPEIKKELVRVKKESRMSTETFMDNVKKFFNIDNFDKMEAEDQKLMRKMKNMDIEIFKVRHTLIRRNHTIASKQERLNILDDLGNGLYVKNFKKMQIESQSLGEKIEEKINELNSYRVRCITDIHFIAHIREKKHMLRNTILGQKHALGEILGEKQRCREYLNDLKAERQSYRRKFSKHRFQNGLLNRPKFLRDYDATEEEIKKLTASVKLLESENIVLEEKLKEIKNNQKLIRR